MHKNYLVTLAFNVILHSNMLQRNRLVTNGIK